MTRKPALKAVVTALVFVVVSGATIRLWCGVYQHDEFAGETYLFVKHRPIWKWWFYSPIGQSDDTLNGLGSAAQKEQLLYWEFVRDRQKVQEE